VKVAFLAHFRGGSESGILRKVASQTAAWTELGAQVGLFVATSPQSVDAWRAISAAVSVRTPPGGPFGLLREREALVADVGRWHPDVVYARHGLAYPGLLRLARRLPTVVEVNGDDLAEFRLLSLRRYWLARLTRSLLLRRAAGLVFVTHELRDSPSFAGCRRPSAVIGNGIDLSAITPAARAHNSQPRLIFIGHPRTPWHGLEHVAELAEAFPGWQVDVIGPDSEELGRPAPQNLFFHGPLTPADYRPLLAAADAAIGTLGLYRKGMAEASSLKVREYLATGLPVILGHRDTDFPTGAPFLLELANGPRCVLDATARIRDFVESWAGRRVAREDVAQLDTRIKERLRLDFIAGVAHG
jgi:glycosyltransferase involved in cell wall biosynthesis